MIQIPPENKVDPYSPESKMFASKLPEFLRCFDTDSDGTISETESEVIRNLPQNQLEDLEERIAYLIVQEVLAASKLLREHLVPTEGISFDEFRILALLYSHHSSVKKAKRETGSDMTIGLSQKFIASDTNVSTSLVSGLLDKMDQALTSEGQDTRKWIARTENRLNRKEKLISLTPDGCRAFLKARKDFKTQIKKAFLPRLNIRQLVEMYSSLFDINAAMDPKHDTPPDDSDESDS